ncbi:MAG TPA: hypothetical protein VGE06_10340 [Flavisolibacter sp.]
MNPEDADDTVGDRLHAVDRLEASHHDKSGIRCAGHLPPLICGLLQLKYLSQQPNNQGQYNNHHNNPYNKTCLKNITDQLA